MSRKREKSIISESKCHKKNDEMFFVGIVGLPSIIIFGKMRPHDAMAMAMTSVIVHNLHASIAAPPTYTLIWNIWIDAENSMNSCL